MPLGAINLLRFNEANRVVIARIIEKPNFAEIIMVSDDACDFAPICCAFSVCPQLYNILGVEKIVERYFPGLPIAYVEISHYTKSMTCQQAFSTIMGRKIEIPEEAVLEKRRMQNLWWDGDSKSKKRAEGEYKKKYGLPLWDGTERIFAETK